MIRQPMRPKLRRDREWRRRSDGWIVATSSLQWGWAVRVADVVAFLGFGLCAGVILFAGRGLSRYGDRIAEISGLGGAWVGLILMAAVTSLPELMVSISSAAVVGSADLAVGNIIGSCAFNLIILAGLDAFVPARRPILNVASASHVLAAALGIVLLALVGIGLVDPDEIELTPWIGISSLLFIGVYLGSVRLLYLHARRVGADGSVQPTLEGELPTGQDAALLALPTRKVVLRYTLYAVVIVAAATLLPPLAERIAVVTGLQESFVGTLLLAASSSLPEIAVSLAAVRMGAIDLAVGNILGSNLFNILILAVGDIAYSQGVLLRDAANIHIISVLSTIAMSAIVIIGLTYTTRGKRFLLAWDAALIIAIYAANLMLLLTLRLP